MSIFAVKLGQGPDFHSVHNPADLAAKLKHCYMNSISDKLDQARNVSMMSIEHFFKFIYHAAVAISLFVLVLYLWLKDKKSDMVAGQEMKAEKPVD